MVIYTPRRDLSGTTFVIATAFSGVDDAANRVYSLFFGGSVVQGLQILVNGTPLQYGIDYTFSAGSVTFLVPINNVFSIQIDYFTVGAGAFSSGTNTEYASPAELSEFMGLLGEMPNPQIRADTRLLEVVGLGNDSTTRFYVDNSCVLSNTYMLYYGATEASALSHPLTETTHYSLDMDSGIIILTPAGVTLVGTNNIYAAYSFNTVGLSDSDLQSALNKAASYVDKKINGHFTDGTATTPDYEVVLDEKLDGRGLYARAYFSYSRPVADVQTTLSLAVSISDAVINVVSTQGFPSVGVVGIDIMKVSYTGKTGTTFTGCSGVTATASLGDGVYSWVVEASNSVEGTSPTWTVLEKDEDYDVEFATGRFHFSQSSFNITDAQAWALNPPQGVPNRFRLSYLSGYGEIPGEIKQVTLMVASQDLMHRVVRKAHVTGLNDFNPALINVDQELIDKILMSYKQLRVGTTP